MPPCNPAASKHLVPWNSSATKVLAAVGWGVGVGDSYDKVGDQVNLCWGSVETMICSQRED